MKLSQLIPMFLAAALALPALAQDAPAEDESSRLMQAYMAKRAEWVALRERAQKRAKEAKDDTERKAIFKKLDDDEGALRTAAASLAKQAHDAEEAKHPEVKVKPKG